MWTLYVTAVPDGQTAPSDGVKHSVAVLGHAKSIKFSQVCLLPLISNAYNLEKIGKRELTSVFEARMIKAWQHQIESLKRLSNEQVFGGHFGVDAFIMKDSERRAEGHVTV